MEPIIDARSDGNSVFDEIKIQLSKFCCMSRAYKISPSFSENWILLLNRLDDRRSKNTVCFRSWHGILHESIEL